MTGVDMTELTGKREEILDVAEAMIRTAGFNGFSTREVAEAVGIKAASVHYHFPSKADMGIAVTGRYTDRFLEALGNPDRFKGHPRQAVKLYVDSFRQALIRDRSLCLCAVLGAEIGGLPREVGGRTRIFFERNIEWLRKALTASSQISAAREISIRRPEAIGTFYIGVGDQFDERRLVRDTEKLPDRPQDSALHF